MSNLISPLSDKQLCQILRLSRKTQSFLCSDTSTFIELIKISQRSSNTGYLKIAIDQFKSKYYPKGYKENKKVLNQKQANMVYEYELPRFQPFYKPYREIEMTAFIRVVRACRDYMFSVMSEEDTNLLTNRIEKSYELVTN